MTSENNRNPSVSNDNDKTATASASGVQNPSTTASDSAFELTNVLTWGVAKDKKYPGYTIPIAFDPETADKIREIAANLGAKDPVYGGSRTLYLKSEGLSRKQTKDLLGKGRCHVNVRFVVRDTTYTKGDTRYLITRVIRLRKFHPRRPISPRIRPPSARNPMPTT